MVNDLGFLHEDAELGTWGRPSSPKLKRMMLLYSHVPLTPVPQRGSVGRVLLPSGSSFLKRVPDQNIFLGADKLDWTIWAKNLSFKPRENPMQSAHCSPSPASRPGPFLLQNQPCLQGRSIPLPPKQLAHPSPETSPAKKLPRPVSLIKSVLVKSFHQKASPL